MAKTEIARSGNGGRRSPSVWHPLEALHDDMERLFNRYVPTNFTPSWLSEINLTSNLGQLDLRETDDAFDITVDVPGMKPEDIDVSLNGTLLTIKGERKEMTEEKKKDFQRIERSYGAFQRHIDLAVDVEEDKIAAKVKDGELSLHLPKSAKAKAHEKKIAIKAS